MRLLASRAVRTARVTGGQLLGRAVPVVASAPTIVRGGRGDPRCVIRRFRFHARGGNRVIVFVDEIHQPAQAVNWLLTPCG